MRSLSDPTKRARKRTLAGFSRGEVDSKVYTFVQLADTQLGMMKNMVENSWYSTLRTVINALTLGYIDWPPFPALNSDLGAEDIDEREKQMCRDAVSAINQLEPRPIFAVVCGDLVNAYPSPFERGSPAEASGVRNDDMKQDEQIKSFKHLMSQIHEDIALVCVCGNHDLGERPNAVTLKKWEQNFGNDYFSFWVGEDKYIVINSQLYKNAEAAEDEAAQQDLWLDQELNSCKVRGQEPRHIVVFSHIPPFCYDPEEGSGYFPLEKKIRLDLLRRMTSAGVSHWFCGHYHRNAGGIFRDTHHKRQLEVVTTAAVGGNIKTNVKGDRLGLSGMESISIDSDTSGLRVVKVNPNGISHEFSSLSHWTKK